MKKFSLVIAVLVIGYWVFVRDTGTRVGTDEKSPAKSVFPSREANKNYSVSRKRPAVNRNDTPPKGDFSLEPAPSVIPRPEAEEAAAPVATNTPRGEDTVVRQHPPPPPPLAGEPRLQSPPMVSKVEPITLVSVRTSFRPAMKDCISLVADQAEEGASAQARLTVSVSDATLRVDKVEFQSSGLPSEAQEVLRKCAVGAMLGHEEQVEGSEEVREHFMTFPYAL